MNFLGKIKSNNIMFLETIYHYPNKERKYKDSLDIIYKDLTTGEKHILTIDEPEMEIYFTKEEFKNFQHNKSFSPLNETECHRAKYKDLPFYIAKQAGEEYLTYIKQKIETRNRYAINNLHKYRYVFGSDYNIENWYRIQWLLNYHNDKPKPITKTYLDIEVDSIEVVGFPKDGECPINAITLIDETTNTCFTFLLENKNNPQIEEFKKDIDNFIEELHNTFDESYGKLNYNIYMYEDESELLIDTFKLINTLKRDFLMIWNIGFDVPYMIARMKELDLDPKEVMCHPDFNIKELMFVKDMRNFKVANKGDYFKISSYTVFLDQMIVYASLRKGGSELRSNALTYVAEKEISDKKLDYAEDGNIKTLPYRNYKKFVMYNIKDVLLQLGIERKVNDIDNVYQRSYTNATTYKKVFRQTV